MSFKICEIPKAIKDEILSLYGQIDIEDLVFINLSYFDFLGQRHTNGEMIASKKIAHHIVTIFKILHDTKFPIHNISHVNKYNWDDTRCMKQNNTSCFNYRKIDGTNKLSKHALGLALDINPVQNPCIVKAGDGSINIIPQSGSDYLVRENVRDGMLESTVDGTPIYQIFLQNGFNTWGGHWSNPVDLHHFQVD